MFWLSWCHVLDFVAVVNDLDGLLKFLSWTSNDCSNMATSIGCISPSSSRQLGGLLLWKMFCFGEKLKIYSIIYTFSGYRGFLNVTLASLLLGVFDRKLKYQSGRNCAGGKSFLYQTMLAFWTMALSVFFIHPVLCRLLLLCEIIYFTAGGRGSSECSQPSRPYPLFSVREFREWMWNSFNWCSGICVLISPLVGIGH